MRRKNKKPSESIIRIIKNGDALTRLSILIMGAGNLARGQIIKGLVFLFAEFGFIYYVILYGKTAALQMRNLGENSQGRVFDESKGVFVKVDGDNSMLILLAGVIGIFVLTFYILIWRASLKSAYEAQKCIMSGKKPNSIKQDVADYFNGKLHRTLLFLPIGSLFVFNIVPLLYMILIAFTNFDGSHQPPGNLFTWVGMENFKTMLSTGDAASNFAKNIGGTFWPVLGWTLIWAVFATFLNYILGMLLAIIINRPGTRLKKLWRTVFVLSIAVPQFVSLLTMKAMLQDMGAINIMLKEMGIITESLPFLSNATWARVTVIVVNLWIGIPYTMLVTTGVLQNIPEDYYEAAKVDGANVFVIFFKITLPYMLFVTTPHLISAFVANINNFGVIYYLTAGGPNTLDYYQAGKTDLLVTWLYKLTTVSFDYNYAAVIGILIFIISAVCSLFVYRRTGSYKNEEGFQ